MEPFVAAMLAALSAAAVNLADDVVKDAYQGLKSVLKDRFSNDPIATATVDNFEQGDEKRIERNAQTLQGCLEETDLSQDEKVNEALDNLSTKIEERAKLGHISVKQSVLKAFDAHIVGVKVDNVQALGGKDVDVEQDLKGVSRTTLVGFQSGGTDKPDDE